MGSAVIVNNRVALSSTAAHAAVGGSRLLYIANRPGAVKLKTGDDIRIERENEMMAKLGYIGFRPGSVAGPDARHALFDLNGIPEKNEVRRRLAETSSAIITTVVSVRNEDAEALELLTKEQWERAVRANWPRYVERLGVIAPENVEFVAAFHVSKTSHHVHIFTWDRSGEFDSLLPRRRMVEANDELCALMLRPRQEALNLARTESRDELVAMMRSTVGADAALAERVRERLPESGSLRYRSIAKRAPEAARAVEGEVRAAVRASPDMAEARQRHVDAVRENARLKSLSGGALEAYVRATERDLDARLCNAAIAAALPTEGRARASVAARPAARPDAGAQPELAPRDRRRATALREELHSCLTARERSALAASMAGKEGGPAEAEQALRKLPLARTWAATGTGSIGTAAARAAPAIARLLAEPTARRRRGDAGDEAGHAALRALERLARAAWRVLRLARHAPRAAAQAEVPTPKMKG